MDRLLTEILQFSVWGLKYFWPPPFFPLLEVLIWQSAEVSGKVGCAFLLGYGKGHPNLLLGRPFNQLVVFNCIFKNNWFYSFPKKISLTSLNQQSHTHNHSEVITMPSFSRVPRFSVTVAPSWEPQGEVLGALTVERTWLGTHLWGLAWSCGHSWWAGSASPMSPVWSQLSRELEDGLKETRILSGRPCLSQGSLLQPGWSHRSCCQQASMIGISLGPPWNAEETSN